MSTKERLTVSVTSGWGTFGFDLRDDKLHKFVQIVVALSQWKSIDLKDVVISERDAKTGRFKKRFP